MKKSGSLALFIMTILMLIFMTGCSDSEVSQDTQAKPLDISGEYAGTMTFSKVEIVYDTDEDENGQEIRNYYEPDEESSWVGESVDVNFQVVKNEDQSVYLASINEDGEESSRMEGSYDPEKNQFYQLIEEPGGIKVRCSLLVKWKSSIKFALNGVVSSGRKAGLTFVGLKSAGNA